MFTCTRALQNADELLSLFEVDGRALGWTRVGGWAAHSAAAGPPRGTTICTAYSTASELERLGALVRSATATAGAKHVHVYDIGAETRVEAAWSAIGDVGNVTVTVTRLPASHRSMLAAFEVCVRANGWRTEWITFLAPSEVYVGDIAGALRAASVAGAQGVMIRSCCTGAVVRSFVRPTAAFAASVRLPCCDDASAVVNADLSPAAPGCNCEVDAGSCGGGGTIATDVECLGGVDGADPGAGPCIMHAALGTATSRQLDAAALLDVRTAAAAEYDGTGAAPHECARFNISSVSVACSTRRLPPPRGRGAVGPRWRVVPARSTRPRRTAVAAIVFGAPV